MADKERLSRMKEIIEKGEATASEKKEFATHLDSILERLAKKSAETAQPEGRALKIKEQLEGGGERQIDFAKLHFDKSADDKVRMVGKFYGAFRTPISVIAAFFSSLPAATELESNLKAADISLKPDAYIVVASTVAFVSALAAIMLSTYFAALFGAANDILSTASVSIAIGLLVFVAVGVAGVVYPSMKAESRAREIDRELPFALRQLATQVKAGVSFQKALVSIGEADYGMLSKEIRRLLNDMEAGKSTEDALMDLHDRTHSRGLRQASMQIMRTLKSGGGLANIISSIASDVSFETRMKVRDFTEQLNLINVVFIMTAVVAPVVLTIIVSVMQLPLLGGGIDHATTAAIFAVVCAAMLTIIFFIRRIEPMAG